MICDDKREGGTAISLYNRRNVMICGAVWSAEGWTSQPVSSNRSCLQWLGVVDGGSASAENQMERSLSTFHLLPPFQSVLTRNYSSAHRDTQKEQHTLTHTHMHVLLLIMSNIRWWNKHCQVMGESLAAFPPTPSETSGSQGHTLQLYHHYTLVHSAASVFSILNQAGTELISLSSPFSRLSGCWIFCD